MKKFIVLCLCYIQAIIPARAQPGQANFWPEVAALVKNSQALSPDKHLKELVSCYSRITGQHFRYDTTYQLLLRKISDLFAEKDDYLKAIRYTREAISYISGHTPLSAIDNSFLIKNYYYLSEYYSTLNQPAEKVRAMESCIDVANKTGIINTTYLYVLWMRVKYLFDVGDYVRCIQYARTGERDAAKLTSNQLYFSSIFSNFEINAHLEQYDFRTAEKLLSGKASLYKQQLPEMVTNVYQQMGRVELGSGNSSKALEHYSTALKSLEKGDSLRNLQVLENTGYYIYFKNQKNPVKALQYYFRALKYVKLPAQQTTEETQEALNLLTNIGSAYTEAGKFDSAFYFFQQAFDKVAPGMNEKKFVNLPQDIITRYDRMWYITGLMIDKGNALLKLYKQTHRYQHISTAMEVYQAADKLLARIRLEQAELASRLFWRYDSRRLYEQAIEAAFLTKDVTRAFYFFEKNRAVILDEQLMQQHLLNNENILEQAQLQRTIFQLKKQLQEKGTLSDEANSTLFNSTRRLDRLQEQIKNNNLLYYQRFIDTSFIDLQQVRLHLLNEGQLLTEIFNGDSAVYVLQTTATDSSLRRIDKQDYTATVAKYNTYLANPSLLNRDYYNFRHTAYHLYQLLFGDKPVLQQRIIVSPDGQYFPLESLVTDERTEDIYFLHQHAVSYTYSARFLLGENKSTTALNEFMGMAPVVYANNPDLADLPGSDESLIRMEQYFKTSRLFIRDKATRLNFLQNFADNNIIQLYTHAADTSDHGEPVIYFSDSALYLSELVPNKKTSTQLIVLSACETGSGNYYQGEGVFSFNRAFASIGIPSAVINLWAVDNIPTYRITELFYKYLSKGLPTDIALQKAKLDFLQNSSKESILPYYWAATVLAGKTAPIVINNEYSWLQYLVLVLAAVAAYLAGLQYWRKTRKATTTKERSTILN